MANSAEEPKPESIERVASVYKKTESISETARQTELSTRKYGRSSSLKDCGQALGQSRYEIWWTRARPRRRLQRCWGLLP